VRIAVNNLTTLVGLLEILAPLVKARGFGMTGFNTECFTV